MINLRITMNNGEVHEIQNLIAKSVTEFSKNALMPYGSQQTWYEILPGVLINTHLISSIVSFDPVREKELLDGIEKQEEIDRIEFDAAANDMRDQVEEEKKEK